MGYNATIVRVLVLVKVRITIIAVGVAVESVDMLKCTTGKGWGRGRCSRWTCMMIRIRVTTNCRESVGHVHIIATCISDCASFIIVMVVRKSVCELWWG